MYACALAVVVEDGAGTLDRDAQRLRIAADLAAVLVQDVELLLEDRGAAVVVPAVGELGDHAERRRSRPAAPIQSGGCGRWSGFGSFTASATERYLPVTVARSSVHIAFRMRAVSAMRSRPLANACGNSYP